MLPALAAIGELAAPSAIQKTTQTAVGATQEFTSMLASAAGSVAQSLNHAEQTSAAGLTGSAGPRAVAEAVMEAEQSLQMAIAVRDKIVAAVQEISRMSI
ncbi:MAG: flagellar hook-basal body complex protein FliE [Hyphomicrobiales bacterium]|nr:flagellar hook-basal body complex protein FliE [Hyphomicrobiales bacterium]